MTCARRRRTWSGAAAMLTALTLALLPGCGSSPDRAPASDPAAIAAEGLELSILLTEWIPGGVLESRLAPLALAPSLDPALRARWERHGVRLIVMPVDEARRLRAEVPPAGPAQTQFVGQLTRFSELWSGPARDRAFPLALDGDVVTFPPGRVRLLARCWVAPSSVRASIDPAAAALRVELLPQVFEAPRRDRRELLVLAAPTPEITAQGVLVDRLRSEIELQPGEALVLVAEAPGAVWGEPNPPPLPDAAPPAADEIAAGVASDDAAPPSSAPEGAPAAEARDDTPGVAFGPALPAIPDVGRAMLGGVAPSGRPARTVLILMPIVRDRLELIRRPG